MAFITVSNSFTNSTTADASQVNTNFSDIINGTSDGTKDFSIAALTLAGVLTANGNVILGNASSDDVTITGSLAATLNIKTNTSYDVGSSTLGLRYMYFGGSSTFTARVGAATLAASRNYTIPEVGATAEFVMTQGIVSVTAGTTTLTTNSQTVLCNTSGGVITLNLPAASGLSGKRIRIKKTSSDLTLVTIDGNGAETIDGATTKTIAFQYESLELECDGSNWHTIAYHRPFVGLHYNSNDGDTITNATTNYMDFPDSVYESHSGLVSGANSGPVTTTNTGFKITSPVNAYWHVVAACKFAGTFAAGGYVFMGVRVDDTLKIFKGEYTDTGTAGDTPSGMIAGDVYVPAGSRIEIEINISAGGNKGLSTDSSQVFVTAHMIER